MACRRMQPASTLTSAAFSTGTCLADEMLRCARTSSSMPDGRNLELTTAFECRDNCARRAGGTGTAPKARGFRAEHCMVTVPARTARHRTTRVQRATNAPLILSVQAERAYRAQLQAGAPNPSRHFLTVCTHIATPKLSQQTRQRHGNRTR